jgi:site-specific DNA-methyltransferase (adenine-specific)
MGSLNGSLNGGGCESIDKGRFPANFIHDGSDEVIALFPETGASRLSLMGKGGDEKGNTVYGKYGDIQTVRSHNDNGGSAARFFYCAKASKSERGEGNIHPTVKPLKLMEYLVTLASREGYVVLDPFMGSGTTGIACANLGRKFIGIEQDETYFKIAQQRIPNQTFITSQD